MLQLSLAGAVPSQAHVNGELAGGAASIKTVTSADASKHGLQKSSGSNTLYDPILAASNAALMGQMDAATGREVSNLYKTNRPVSERRIAPNGGFGSADEAFDAIGDIRSTRTITDRNGGTGTVSITEINGQRYVGVNSTNFTDADKALAKQWEAELGIPADPAGNFQR